MQASRSFLVNKGISGVKVEPIARELGVTPGSFYWHFDNRKALHRALLKNWLSSNVTPFFSVLEEAEDNPRAQYLALAYVWVLSPQFDAKLDVAIREWGKNSKLVARLMRIIDHKRIALYQWIFEGFGHEPMSALVRARTMYYHQIGYYTLDVEETSDERLMQIPHYAEIIAGDAWLKTATTPESVQSLLINFPRRKSVLERISSRNSNVES